MDRVTHFASMMLRPLILASCFAFSPALLTSCTAAEWHPVAAMTGGFRLFGDDLDLQDHFSYGARFGISDGSRTTLFLDYVECHTWRRATSADSDIFALRALLRFDLLRTRLRPYVTGGFGGMMLQFNDAPNAGVGVFTYGLGADLRCSDRWSLFAEGTQDTYTENRVIYDSSGAVYGRGYRGTFSFPTVSAGILAHF